MMYLLSVALMPITSTTLQALAAHRWRTVMNLIGLAVVAGVAGGMVGFAVSEHFELTSVGVPDPFVTRAHATMVGAEACLALGAAIAYGIARKVVKASGPSDPTAVDEAGTGTVDGASVESG